MFIVEKKEDGQLVEVASAEDRSVAEKLAASLRKHWPAQYNVRESVPEGSTKKT